MRKTECVFRTKFKRGPQPSNSSRESSSKKQKKAKNKAEEKEEDSQELASTSSSFVSPCQSAMVPATSTLPQGISWHERRCWNVFFSIFKHQNKKDNPIAWCWFALQLDQLRRQFDLNGNQQALSRLEAWMKTLNSKVAYETTKMCKFPPYLCAGCSALALSNRSQNLPPNSMVLPKNISEVFFCDPSHSNLPFIEFEMDSDGARIVSLNKPFLENFKHTMESLSQALSWSRGGAFLPWGGDLLARLVWSEADLLIFLQVLAVKFQGLGPPKHDHDDPESVNIRQLLSVFTFDVRVASEVQNNFSDEQIIPCLMKAVLKETVRGADLKVFVSLEFEMLGQPQKGPDTPESSKDALEASLNRFPSQQQYKSQQSGLNEIEQVPLPTVETDAALLEGFDWPTFEALECMVSREASSSSSRDDEVTFSYALKSQPSDEDWLQSILDWTD